MALYEIVTASKEHDEAAIRAGLASERPGASIERIAWTGTPGEEWSIYLKQGDDDSPFPPKKDESDDSGDKPKSDDSDEKKDSDDDDGEKSEKKDGDKGKATVEKLRGLMDDLQKTMQEVVQNAEDVAAEADSKQQKMEEIHDSVKEHVNGDGDGAPKGDLGDMPDAPIPSDAAGLDDLGLDGPPKPPAAPGPPKRPGVPSGKPKPPTKQPGVPTFTHTEVARHPGVDDEGNRLSLSQVVAAIENQDDMAEYEVVGLVALRDGSYSAKLVKKETTE